MEQQGNSLTEKKIPTIVIFNNKFISISETFIYRQILALAQKFEIRLLGYELVNQGHFDLSNYRFDRVNRNSSVLERVFTYLLRNVVGYYVYYRLSTLRSLCKYFERNNFVVHAHYGWNGVFLLPFLKNRGIPLIVSFHGSDASGWLTRKWYANRLPQLFKYATHIILCSDHMINKLGLEDYLDKVSVIPYGIDTEEFQPFSRQDDLTTVKILHSGRLVSKKGVPDLIRVFERLRREYSFVRLQIVGDGIDRSRCEKLVDEFKLRDCVFFFGARPQPEVKVLMNACDIFVLNSRTDESGDMEGLPNALLEAMAFEKPVVSTDHAGIPMAIRHEETGLLVAESDNENLYKMLEKLILDQSLRLRLGKNARERIISNFSLNSMSLSLQEVISKCK